MCKLKAAPVLGRKGKKERERRLERREREGERKGRERVRGVEREREVTAPLDKGYTGRRGLNYGAACVCLCLIYGLSSSCHPPLSPPCCCCCRVTGTSLCPTCRIILHIFGGRFLRGFHTGLRNMPGQILQLLF